MRPNQPKMSQNCSNMAVTRATHKVGEKTKHVWMEHSKWPFWATKMGWNTGQACCEQLNSLSPNYLLVYYIWCGGLGEEGFINGVVSKSRIVDRN